MHLSKYLKIIIMSLIIATSNILATKYYVRGYAGNDKNDGLTPQTAWQTIGRAAKDGNIGPGDTVIVGPAWYSERVSISQSGNSSNMVTYYGDYEARYVPDGPGDVTISSGKNYSVRLSSNSYVRLRGFTITGANSNGIVISGASFIYIDTCNFNWNSKRGMYISNNSSNIYINDCVVQGGSNPGIDISSSNNIYIYDFDINYSDMGIRLNGVSNINIYRGNFLWNSDYGIYVKSSSNVSIENCQIQGGNQRGIYITDSDANNISGNNITNTPYGIYVDDGSTILSIYNNEVYGCNNYGINISNSTIRSIHDNLIYNIWGSAGIYVYSSGCDSIYNNLLHDCQNYGIRVYNIPQANSVAIISNNEIYNVWSYDGIFIQNSNCDKVIHNIVHDISSRAGIYIISDGSYYINRIDSNTIYSCGGDGIYFSDPANIQSIKGNTIYDIDEGILINASTPFSIGEFRDNIIHTIGTGGIYASSINNTTIENNLIYYGKYSTAYGIRIYSNGGYSVDIKNNTIYSVGGTGLYGSDVSGFWRNNIVVGNSRGIHGSGVFDVILGYNCVYGNSNNWYGVASPGNGSISEDPLFVDPDGSDNVLGGDGWSDDDFHLQSQAGSYHGGLWTADANHSPCIDGGYPGDDYSLEPEDNGDLINMGCYGNTSQASKSLPYRELVYSNFPLNVWVMVGVPLVPLDGDPFAVYGDDFGNQMPDGSWGCIRWTTEDSVSEYYEYGYPDTSYWPPDCYPGISHFIWQNIGSDINVDVEGKQLRVPDTLDVAAAPNVDWQPPAPGFNMFANPYPYLIDWSNTVVLLHNGSSVQEMSLIDAANAGIISQYAYLWDHVNGQYELVVPNYVSSVDTISVWKGFWFIQLDKVSDIDIVIPNRRILGKVSEVQRRLSRYSEVFRLKRGSYHDDWDWFLKIGVISEDGKLRDMENLVGVCKGSKDGLDAWDAYDFQGIDRMGNFVDMKFRGPDDRPLAYEFKGSFGKGESKEWNIEITVNSSNKGKKYYILWPHIRMLPGYVKFSLLDEDGNLLIEDLRDSDGYRFVMRDSLMRYRLRGEVVEDNSPPAFRYVIAERGISGGRISLYIVSDEPLDSIGIELDGEEKEVRSIDDPPRVYYSDIDIGYGNHNVKVLGKDLSGNEGTMDIGLARLEVGKEIVEEVELYGLGMRVGIDDGITVNELLISRGEMAIDIPRGMELVDSPVYIGPEGIDTGRKLRIDLAGIGNKERLSVYRFSGGKWEYISRYNGEMIVDRSGIYAVMNDRGYRGDDEIEVVIDFRLDEPFPNPFNNRTMIGYVMGQAGDVSLKVYDLLGREVYSEYLGRKNIGYHVACWDGRDLNGKILSSGMYIVKIFIRDKGKVIYNNNKKVVLVK
ncbi:MAG: right-handed parallel beta-helix repeat-containing protein [Candidatus Marinimicrobia bacterium]|nr:right-handed parallel beta-helix repeat-containing protein [Candidatus Neomarinimicrobiota bacterium]